MGRWKEGGGRGMWESTEKVNELVIELIKKKQKKEKNVKLSENRFKCPENDRNDPNRNFKFADSHERNK